VTTRWDLAIEVAAYRMFERWTQENFFRYMRQHFSLDALVTYAVEPADPERTVPNPQRKALAKALAKRQVGLKELEQRYGAQALTNAEAQRPTMRGFKIANAELGQQIRTQQAETQALHAQLTALPKRVPVKEVVDGAVIVRLAPEAKHLTDSIKMLAYRAETALARLLADHYARTEDEGRALIREMLLSDADILPIPRSSAWSCTCTRWRTRGATQPWRLSATTSTRSPSSTLAPPSGWSTRPRTLHRLLCPCQEP
jgi:hypothetical protein